MIARSDSAGIRVVKRLGYFVALSCALLLLLGCREESSKAPRSGEKGHGSIQSSAAQEREKQVNPDFDKRLGDGGMTKVEDPQAKYFPQRERWVDSGVSGGIPALETARMVSSGDDLQAAVNALGKGVLQLGPGEYTIPKRLTLKSGIVLRGEKKTVIRYGAGDDPVAVHIKDAERSGIEGIVFLYEDPERYARGPHLNDQTWANAPGFKPLPDAAIQLIGARNCWVSDVSVNNALSHPLALRECQNITVRDVQLHGALNRGQRAGSLVVANSRNLLLAGISLRELRHAILIGPVADSVFKGWVSGAAIYLQEADAVQGNLFEDLHFLFRPGYFFMPFSKDGMPLGPDNLLYSVSAYHHGTDAMSGNILKERFAYQLNPNQTKPNADRHTQRNERGFISPYKHIRSLPLRTNQVRAVEPVWEQSPKGIRLSRLRNGAALDDWAYAILNQGEALSVSIGDLVANPLIADRERELAGHQVQVSWTESSTKEILGSRIPSFNINRNMGQFGWAAVVPGGEEVNLLKLANNDWSKSLILQRVMHLPGDPLVLAKLRAVGCEAQVFLNETELQKDEICRLKPGYHAITVKAQLEQKMSLITTATLSLVFALQEEPQAPVRVLDVSVPSIGSLYPYHPGVDPLIGERVALKAWPVFFNQTMRKTPLRDFNERVRTFATEHAGTHVGWLAEGILNVANNAPHQEDENLDPWEWGRLFDYYAQSGMPERKWVGGKRIKGASAFRDFYPERVKP